MPNNITFLSGYENHPSTSLEQFFPALIKHNFVTDTELWPLNSDRNVLRPLSVDNTDYQTDASTYLVASNYIRSKDVLETSPVDDPVGLAGQYQGYVTNTQLYNIITSIDVWHYMYKILAADGSYIYAKIKRNGNDNISSGRIYTIGYVIEIGHASDQGVETSSITQSFVINGTAASTTDGRIYYGCSFQFFEHPDGQTTRLANPCFYFSFLPCRVSSGKTVNFPGVPFDYGGDWYSEYYPVNGCYFKPDSYPAPIAAMSNLTITAQLKLIVFNAKAFAAAETTVFPYLENDSPQAGPASGEGGMNNGTFDDSSDTIALPDLPSIGVTNVGFVNVYKTGLNSLQNLGMELFPPLQYTAPSMVTGVDLLDMFTNAVNEYLTFLANVPSFFQQLTAATLINYIIDCHVIPVTPSSGSTEAIKVGNRQLTVSGDRLTADYVDVPCGSISLGEYYANFADFLTTFKLYLPFVGFVPARPEWFNNDSISVNYRFNVIDGSFVAFVSGTGQYVNNGNPEKTILGQYGGVACVHLPITGVTYANMVSGLVGAAGGMAVGAATGNVAAIASSAIAAAQAHGDIAQSNAYSAGAAFLGCRRPFVLIERPVSDYSATYQHEDGIPSNISMKIGNLTGFAVIGDVHLDGIDATDQEKAEIERLLHEGIIL